MKKATTSTQLFKDICIISVYFLHTSIVKSQLLLWSKYLYPPQIYVKIPTPQCDGIRRWRPLGGDEVMRVKL